jgi:hypothetical protein
MWRPVTGLGESRPFAIPNATYLTQLQRPQELHHPHTLACGTVPVPYDGVVTARTINTGDFVQAATCSNPAPVRPAGITGAYDPGPRY